MNKVAAISLSFWMMKICATTLGETAGDLLSITLGLGYAIASLVLLGVFAATLVAQIASERFHPALYWAVILSTSTAGTVMSDFMDRTLGFGYASGSAVLACLLVAVIGLWALVERDVSVEGIRTRRAEGFYWAAILVSNTLGTALGDFLADDSGLGFFMSAGLIAGAIAAIALASAVTRISRVALFWMAFVLTRPFGATFGDLLTKSSAEGGMDLGTIGSSMALAVLLGACFVATYRRPLSLGE